MPTREGILSACGIVPSVNVRLQAALAEAVERATAALPAGAAGLTVLDAGCGRSSALEPYRSKIARFVGIDVHEPATGSMPYLDEFEVVDVCGDVSAFAPGSFDVALSSFTVEHFADPVSAFTNLRRWLRPGGTLVITTVNKRHPFVAAYLGAPAPLRHRLQRVVKATAADAHPIVGVCNSPSALRAALTKAGFENIRITPIGHLARAWGKTWPTFIVGLAGDLFARPIRSARSTLLVTATVPAEATAAPAA